MNKILVIGQAPSAVVQGVPYDTTMLYEWLGEIGITKDEAQNLFEWEAVSNVFPGQGKKGHLKPEPEDMEKHWNYTLKDKVINHDRIWVLGKVAENFLDDKPELKGKRMLKTMHPSNRNRAWYKVNKPLVLHLIEMFVKVGI